MQDPSGISTLSRIPRPANVNIKNPVQNPPPVPPTPISSPPISATITDAIGTDSVKPISNFNTINAEIDDRTFDASTTNMNPVEATIAALDEDVNEVMDAMQKAPYFQDPINQEQGPTHGPQVVEENESETTIRPPASALFPDQ